MCMRVFVLPTCVFPSRGSRMQGLSYECKIDQANFTYWMSFLSSNLLQEINRNPEILSANTLAKINVDIDALIQPIA